MALHGAVRCGTGAHIFEDFLHLDDVAFEPGDLRDRGDLALAVGLALQLHDELDGAGNLAADRGDGHRQSGHADHLLQARDGVARCVGVDGGHRAFMTGVHGLQHVEGFFAAALAENDAVGPHTQRVLDQFALADFAFAFDIRRPRFHAADVRLLKLKFGSVFDGDQTLLFRNKGGKRIQHRGLAGAGAAGNDGGDARFHRCRQQIGHRRTQRADVDQLGQVERLLGEFTDRHQRSVDADRAHRHVDARTVLQARVAERMGFVDTASHRGDNFIDNAQQMLLVLEAYRQRLEHTTALHIDAFMTVDQDIVDALILEQRLERTEAGHLVENFRDEIGEFLRIERQPFGQHVLRHQLLDVLASLLFRQLFQRGEIDLFDQPAMQADLGIEQLVAEQRIGRLRLQRGRLLRKCFRKRRPCPATGLNRRHRLARQRLRSRSTSECETAGHRFDPLISCTRSFRKTAIRFSEPYYCATESLNFLIGAAVLTSA